MIREILIVIGVIAVIVILLTVAYLHLISRPDECDGEQEKDEFEVVEMGEKNEG